MTINRTRDQRSAAVRAGIMRHVAGEGRAEVRRNAKQAARSAVSAKPAEVAKAAQTALAPVVETLKPGPKPMKISDNAIAMARNMRGGKRKAEGMTLEERAKVFAPYRPAPGVFPKGHKLAMDESPLAGPGFEPLNSWGAETLGTSFAEGIGFLGYSYLAALTQRPEYRRISERIATEMTRKWIKFHTVNKPEDDMLGDAIDPEEETADETEVAMDLAPGAGAEAPPAMTDADQEEQEAAGAESEAEATRERVRASIKRKQGLERAKKLKELEDEMTRLKVKDAFYNIAEGDGWFGRYHLFLDVVGGSFADYDRDELKTPLGNGRDIVSQTKVGNKTETAQRGKRKGKAKKGKLQAVRCVEPMWCYPSTYNSTNPLDPDFYNPTMWFVNGIEVHRSRLLTFVGREVPDILKPAYAFGGLSMSQMAKPYVDNWLRTRQAVCDLIESFSVSGVYTNMSGVLQDGGTEALKRIELFNVMRSNAGSYALDKDTEEFFNVSTPLGTLDHLQAQSQEQMSSVSGIPLIILLGITPTGLNASSEGEIRAFYDTIHAFQESFFRDQLQTVIWFVMLSLWGEIDEDITFTFEPLWSMTDKEAAEIRKIDAETDQILINAGVVAPDESRQRVANDPNSLYPDIDPEDVPDPPMQQMGGEDPFGGGDGGGDSGGGDGGGEADGGFGAADEALMEAALLGSDEWNESDHPRADNGQFGAGSGSAASTSKSTAKGSSPAGGSKSSASPLNVAKLKKSGGKLGSNEGGVYTDDAGGKFYVKKPSTKAHVANEMAAARLYQLAGVNTLKYRDAGPDHVATEWEQLGKNNISKFTPEEKAAAAKDFAIHAWLSNWDAAGTGGDNQGIRDGKPVTLDVGGSLRYRAQGGPKGAAFGPKVSEIDTMRNPSMSPDAARLYGKMSDSDLKASVERVTSIPDSEIRKAAGDEQLADVLVQRKQDLAKRFGTIAQDEDMMAAALLEQLEPEEIAEDVFTLDMVALDEFQESKHPRDKDGKFTSGSGGGSSSEDLDKLVLPGSKYDPEKSAEKSFKTKKEQIGHMLTNGTTPKELMAAMGWPSVSMPAQAKSLGMKLEKKDGKYYGTPLSDEEKADAKKADAEKSKQKATAKAGVTPETLPGSPAGQKKPEAEPAPAPAPEAAKPGSSPTSYPGYLGALAELIEKKDTAGLKAFTEKYADWTAHFKANASAAGKEALAKVLGGAPLDAPAAPPPKPKAPQATEAELKKAAKSTPIPFTASSPEGGQLIKAFNDQYAGKTVTGEALNQKVQDFKDMKAAQEKADSEYAAKSAAEKAAAQKAEAEKVAKAAAEKAAKEKAELAEQFAKDPELETHYNAMTALFSGKQAGEAYIQAAAQKVKKAGLNGVISAAGAAPIIAYSGSHYVALNQQLREGKMTKTQWAFTQSLNAGLDKLPKHTETTYRKAELNAHQLALYEPGMIIEERGFMSTSKNQGTWSGSTQFIIHGKSGRDIQKLSSHPSEAEVLFKSGTRFEVVSKSGNTITLKEA